MGIQSRAGRLCRSAVCRHSLVCAVIAVALVCKVFASDTDIFQAALNGDVAKVKSLLKDNPHLASSKDEFGNSSLHWAALKGYKDIVELLLQYGAEVNARSDHGFTPLGNAAGEGQQEIVQLLLAHGVISTGNLMASIPCARLCIGGTRISRNCWSRTEQM
jgi:ankyrin repeat protein